MPLKTVLVEWIDHTSVGDGGWTDLDEVREIGPKKVDESCWACGFVVYESDAAITIVNQTSGGNLEDEDMTVSGDITIAKCAIRSIKELK